MSKPSHRQKEEQEQKLFVSDSAPPDAEESVPATSESAPDNQSDGGASHNNNNNKSSAAKDETSASIVDASSTAPIEQWKPMNGAGMRRHKLVVRTVIASLILMSVGMGFSIYNGESATREIVRGLDLVSAGKWQDGYKILSAHNAEKVGRLFKHDRDQFSPVSLAVYPNSEKFTALGDSLRRSNQLREAEAAYRNAIALDFQDFSGRFNAGHYAMNRPITPVFRLAEVLKTQKRIDEIRQLLMLTKAMHCIEYDATKLAKSVGLNIETAMTEESERQASYFHALKSARQDYINLSFEDRNSEHYKTRKERILKTIDSQRSDFPGFAPAWLVRAEVNLVDDPNTAIKDLNQLLQTYPGLPEALELRALARLSLQQFDEALKDYDRALNSVPNAEYLLVEKAKLLERLGRLDDATSAINRTLRLNPASVKLHQLKSELLSKNGQKEEAMKELRFARLVLDLRRQLNAIKYDEDDSAYLRVAEKMYELKRPDEALSCLEKCRFKKDQSVIQLTEKIRKAQESTSIESGRSN